MNEPRFAFSIPTHSEAEQRQLFDEFGPQGFAALQLKGGQYARYLDQPEQFLSDWGRDKRACAGLICGGSLDADGVASLHRVFDFAAVVGSEMVIFCHGRARAGVTDDDIIGYARQLSDLGEASAARGVKLSLHHHFDNPVMHRADFETFFAAITPGTVGLTLDTAHLQKSGVFDIAGMVRDFGPFIDNVHLKDFADKKAINVEQAREAVKRQRESNRPLEEVLVEMNISDLTVYAALAETLNVPFMDLKSTDGQFKTLGRGEIRFDAIFAALHDIKFQGWLCADEESETSISESLRASYDFIQQGWNAAP